VWDFSADAHLPSEVARLGHIPKILHFGIAVRSVADKLPKRAFRNCRRGIGVRVASRSDGMKEAKFGVGADPV
jgi:hypothetical protein